MNGVWNDCAATASGALARGVCAYAGMEACPRPQPWVGAPLFRGGNMALPVALSFWALVIKGTYIKDQLYVHETH